MNNVENHSFGHLLMELLVATRSIHKMSEIRGILKSVPHLRVIDLCEAGISYHAAEDDLEIFGTYEENALSKVKYFQDIIGIPTVADDSGIEVDALGRAPGVRSKRFSLNRESKGEDRDLSNNAYLLEQLGDKPMKERTARYVCVAALDFGAGGEVTVIRGEADGLIAMNPVGHGGFGYDSLFFDPDLNRTFGEISPGEKCARSHRGKAFRAVAKHINNIVNTDDNRT